MNGADIQAPHINEKRLPDPDYWQTSIWDLYIWNILEKFPLVRKTAQWSPKKMGTMPELLDFPTASVALVWEQPVESLIRIGLLSFFNVGKNKPELLSGAHFIPPPPKKGAKWFQDQRIYSRGIAGSNFRNSRGAATWKENPTFDRRSSIRSTS